MPMCKRCQAWYEKYPLQDDGIGKLRHITGDNINWDPRRCAFENGVFSADNWNCMTMIDLRILCRDGGEGTFCSWHNDESIGVLPIPYDCDQMAFVVLTWYKNRGRCGNAVVMCDDEDIEPLQLATAEAILDLFGDD